MLVFPVLEQTRLFNRVGGLATAYQIGKALDVSAYKARRVLHTLHDLGLVDWAVENHRPNVTKRIYFLTDRGRAVNDAFYYGVSGGKEQK